MITIDITQVDVYIVNSGLPPFEVTGFSDSSDCLSMPDSVELAMFKKGATGAMCASSTGEKGGPVVIKVLPCSPFVDRMAAEVALNRAGVQVPVQLTVTNKTVGDYYVCLNGILISAPIGVTYGRGEASEMVYTFEFQSIVNNPAASKRDSILSTLTGGLVG